MIYTSCYKKCLKGNMISISGDRGRSAEYEGECFPILAPKLSFWKEWHNNIGKVEEKENNYYYIKNYYEEVLKNLDPNEIANILKEKILLCYEDNTEFCHRHIVAYWLEIELGTVVFEVETDLNGTMTVLDRPEWIKEMLLDVIKKDHERNQIKTFVKKIMSKIEGV